VAAACGNSIIGVHIPDPGNQAGWSVDFAPGTTAAQQAQA